MRKLFLLMVLCLGFAASLPGGAMAQTTVPDGYAQGGPYGFAVKKPVMAGACSFCPWGALAEAVKEAAKATPWDIQICYNCSTANSIRLPAGHKLPPLRSGVQISEGSPPPPYAPVDFGASSPGNLHDGYLGLSQFKDDGPYKNLRLIAMIEQPSYLVVAVKASSGITDLADIKTKRLPVKIYTNGAEADTILAYYGLTREALASWGASVGPAPAGGRGGAAAGGAGAGGAGAAAGGAPAGGGRGNAPPPPDNHGNRARNVPDYDVYIYSNAVMANNPESNLMYQLTQVQTLDFLQLPDDLLSKLAQWPMQRVTMPQAYFAGVDRKIATVGRNGQVVFCRDDAPESFSYDIAKALDQHKDVLKWYVLPFSYNNATVANVPDVPLAPGAARYYREVGYIK
jgi:TRAP-type uncharacterized transport system substrate-binding protein